MLSFFRRKQEPRPRLWWEENWEQVRDRYPIGRQFDYLGRKLIVAQYSWDSLHRPRPVVICEYADNYGELHEWCFEVQMFSILLGLTTTPPNNRTEER